MANEIINEEGEVLALELDVNAAKELTESIKSTATATCLLLQQAHDKKAWKTLGYKTWAEYIENEFKFTRVRSYQLLAQASVIKEISEASDTEIFLTEKEAKLIKKELPKITAKVSDETKGLDTDGKRKEKTTAILKEEIGDYCLMIRPKFKIEGNDNNEDIIISENNSLGPKELLKENLK